MYAVALDKYNESQSDYDRGIFEGLRKMIDIMGGEM